MKSVYCIILCFVINLAVAQVNLVPNGSFEDSVHCPLFPSDFSVKNWYNPSLAQPSTPDYFNSCALPGNMSVPDNGVGYQDAYDGFAYAGFYAYTYYEADYYGEYIQIELSESLEKDKQYCLSFSLSIADRSNYAVKRIGSYFSDTSFFLNEKIFSVVPQYETNSHITDKDRWYEIYYKFSPTSSYKFLTIGIFTKYNDVDTLFLGGILNMKLSYYYIDDVSVYLCEDTLPVPSDTFYLHIPNVFTPNADGKNDTWQVNANGVQQLHAAVYNRWGSLLWQQEVQATDTINQTLTISWDGRSNTGMPASAGTYYYLVTCTTKEGEIKKEKGFLTLVR